MKISRLVLLVALVGAACTSTTTTTTSSPQVSITSAPATTTTTVLASPATSSTVTLPLSPTVAVPGDPTSFGYRIEVDAVVSERGATNIAFSSVTTGLIVGDTDAFDAREWFGTQVVRDASYVLIGSEGWVKEDRKPWRELDAVDVISIKSDTVTPTDFAALYDVANTLEWRLATFEGRQARVYDFPSDVPDDLAEWLPDAVARDLLGVEEYELEVWIDAESEYVVRVDMAARGPETMLADGSVTQSGEGALDFDVVYEFLDVNDAGHVAPDVPDLTSADAPDGFYVFEDPEFGFRLNAPLEWTLFPAESFDGYEIPFAVAPSIDVPNDSYFTIAIEDLSASQGLRVDEYAELNLRFITPFNGEVAELRTSEQIESAGLPAWLTVADVVGPDETFTVRTVTIIDGSLGYSLEFLSWDGWYEIDIEQAIEMFDSFEFFDPDEQPSS